ncbi:MAG: hypothetical protein FJY37_03710 [Betaproteobacteria bacterium]|nr:hypothetical protein [Betaproteobacteria bacterium]MBM3739606.1 hypothetical protein [Acidobacteriota bacterium]
MLADQRVCDVYLSFALQTLCRMATGVEDKLPRPTAEEFNAPSVSDTNEKIWVEGKGLRSGKHPETTPVVIAQFDSVRSAADDLAQFLSIEQHDLCGTPRVSSLPMTPGRGVKPELQFLIESWSFMQKTSSCGVACD